MIYLLYFPSLVGPINNNNNSNISATVSTIPRINNTELPRRPAVSTAPAASATGKTTRLYFYNCLCTFTQIAL